MVYGLHEYDWQPRETTHAGADGSTPGQASHAGPAATGPAAVTVTMTDDMTFKPAAVTVPAGATVRWTNPSKDAHTVTADPQKASDAKDVALPAGAGPFDSGKVRPGGTFQHTFTTPGRYKYVCVPHEEMGMTGEVVVTPGH
jgi:plastocyanin